MWYFGSCKRAKKEAGKEHSSTSHLKKSWSTTSPWAAALAAGVMCGTRRSLSGSTFDETTQSHLRSRPKAFESLLTRSKFRKSRMRSSMSFVEVMPLHNAMSLDMTGARTTEKSASASDSKTKHTQCKRGHSMSCRRSATVLVVCVIFS